MSFWKKILKLFFGRNKKAKSVAPSSTEFEVLTAQLTKDVHVDDLACPDGTPVPEGLWPNVRLLAILLQTILDKYGPLTQITILDAYRTKGYNKIIGGVNDSKHTHGLAIDFKVEGIPCEEVVEFVKSQMSDGSIQAGEVGINSDFIHYGIAPTISNW